VGRHRTCVRCCGDSAANALEDLRTLPFNAPFQCLCPCKLGVLPVLPCSSSEFTWPLDLSRGFVAPCCCCSYSCCPKPDHQGIRSHLMAGRQRRARSWCHALGCPWKFKVGGRCVSTPRVFSFFNRRHRVGGGVVN
jgi:hypothetical protein